LIKEVERGASIADVARRHKVQAQRIYRWRRKLASASAERSDFLPVVVRAARSHAAPGYLDVIIGGARLRVEIGTNVDYIANIVLALARGC
jgi:transposase-like protein